MTFLSHALVGASVGVALTNLTGVDASLTIPLNVGLSLLPDVNLLWKNISDHHNDITHYPLIWLIVGGLAYFLEGTTHILSISILISCILHLFLDTFGLNVGVHWFGPIHPKQFSFTKLHKQTPAGDLKKKILQFHHSRHTYYELVTILASTFVIWVL